MNPFFLHKTNLNAVSGQHELVHQEEQDINTNEGSEFLDDAIRMQEQPLMRNEENIAASNYEKRQ